MPPSRWPSIPPKLELVLLLAAATTTYNLTMQMLPSQRIDLAQVRLDEPVAAPSSVAKAPGVSSVVHSSRPKERPDAGPCRVPPGGGPALNARFEPC